MKIAEIKKEKLMVRNSDPDRSKALTMLIDYAEKTAKESNARNEVTEENIVSSAKKLVKETENDIQFLKSKNEDYSHLINELNVYKEFLPKMMNEEEIRKLVDDIPEEEKFKKNMGNLMAKMKVIPLMNTGVLSKILNEVLK